MGGTRNIGGNNSSIIELEKELAIKHNKELALVFTSGYVANDTSLATLAKIMPNIVFFSDEFNHASITSGICNSKAEKHIYRHIDIQHLEELLKGMDINRPKIIVFESAYSMDGLFSPIEKIVNLAKKYNALTFIDEVHTVGLYGKHGAGIADLQGCADKIDMIQGTLGKAYVQLSANYIYQVESETLKRCQQRREDLVLMLSNEKKRLHHSIDGIDKESIEKNIKFLQNEYEVAQFV